ncbi:helix-turn-helix domain-containing protein [Williamsia sp.]|uniref:helix-turn-helix domain-containing protein n=1 Tax=Williamsia sp. TaxID=1872085 RepID=UPI002F92DD11
MPPLDQIPAAELLTSTEVGQIIHKSSRTVVRLVEAGEIPVLGKLAGPNGPYVFRRSDVEHYAADARGAQR